jgi:adenylate cyclase
VPTAKAGLDILLRPHIIAARRTSVGDPAETGYATQRISVGFVNLVGSTALAQRLSPLQLGALLTAFEHLVADWVTAHGGRVAKLIGDAVLYTAEDASVACGIALNLTATLTDHAMVPRFAAGLGSGDVLLHDGDVFGPVVSLAARCQGSL